MPLLSKLVDQDTLSKLQGLAPPVTTAEDLLTRSSLELSIELKCDIHDIDVIKCKVAGSILGPTNPLASWSDLPSSIPVLRKEGESVKIRPSGFAPLDALFDGGFHPGNMIQILGASSSGKTQFALSSAIACAKNGLNVLLLVTNNDIGVYRIRRMLDYLMLQEATLSTERRQQLKLFILSHMFIHHVFDIWSAMDTLCRVKELPTPYDVLIIDCMHQLIAPCLSNTDNVFNAPVAAGAASSGVTAPMPVHFQPIVASLYAQLRGFAGAGVTVMLTNVLDKARGGRQGTAAAAGSGAGNAGTVAGQQPTGTGSISGDVFDHCIVLNSEGGGSVESPESCFSAAITLRPPQYNSRPAQCELRVPRV